MGHLTLDDINVLIAFVAGMTLATGLMALALAWPLI